jgi:hypothetical protein
MWIVCLVLSLIVAALMILSGRWWVGWSSTIAADGSQWHIDARFGAIRWMHGERDTILVGSPPGWHFFDQPHPSWDWWPPVIRTDPSFGLVFVPIWMILPLFLLPGLIGAWRSAKRADMNVP